MTLREAYGMLKFIRKQEALELDTKLKCAGDKKGFEGLQSILNEEAFDSSDVNTDESTPENQELLMNITNLVKAGK